MDASGYTVILHSHNAGHDRKHGPLNLQKAHHAAEGIDDDQPGRATELRPITQWIESKTIGTQVNRVQAGSAGRCEPAAVEGVQRGN